jgi:DNA repair exonuclease SbcCD ATPase subunit
MSTAFAIQTTLYYKTTNCITCGCHIALESEYYSKRLEDRKEFYCPNGHSQYFSGETEAEKLKRQLADKERALNWERERASSLNKQLVRAQNATKRLKKRAAAGVCPCCQRTVRQLASHMQSKHPEFVTEQKS